MRFLLVFTLVSILFTPFLRAEKIIGDMDFSTGNWSMVGIPVHNYKQLPIQKELGAFISKDRKMMEKLQNEWDLEMTFDNSCDYHYSLKFYNDGELIRTLGLNLHCGYITFDGLSYDFDPSEFDQFRTESKSIAWSRISFKDLKLLKKAINTLDKAKDVFWYEDVHQFKYPGFFMISANGLPWNTDLDSLHTEVENKIRTRGMSNSFYLQKYYHLIQDDNLFVTYLVNCEENLAHHLSTNYDLTWRSHLHSQDSVSILAIGIDKQRYMKLMRRN